MSQSPNRDTLFTLVRGRPFILKSVRGTGLDVAPSAAGGATTPNHSSGANRANVAAAAADMLRLLLVLLAAGASVLGLGRAGAPVRAAQPCLAPQQWEGRWVQYDHSTGRNRRAVVSYDGPKQRIRVLQKHKKHAPCQR